MSIALEAEVKIAAIEVDGDHAPLGSHLRLRSHWGNPGLVVVEIEGEAMTVVGSALRAAVKRCERY